MKKRVKIIKMWGGFLDGKLNDWFTDARQPAIWRTRKEACKRYNDVRRIEIHIREE